MEDLNQIKKEEASKLSLLNRIRFYVATHIAEHRLNPSVHDATTVDEVMDLLENALRFVGIFIVSVYSLLSLVVPALVLVIARPFVGFNTAATVALVIFFIFVGVAFIAAFLPDEDPELTDLLIDIYNN